MGNSSSKANPSDPTTATSNNNKKLDQAINQPHPGVSHNYGQPKAAPYAAAVAAASQGDSDGQSFTGGIAQHYTDCQKQHMDSLHCIEQNYNERAVCQPFFNAYRECRQKENERRKAENASKSGGGGWFS